MAIVWVKETHERRESEHTSDGRRYRRQFLVLSDSPATTEYDVQTAAGIPRPGEAYVADTAALVRTVRAVQRQGSRELWDVDIEYATATAEEQQDEPPGSDNPDPLMRPARRSFAISSELVPMRKGRYFGHTGPGGDQGIPNDGRANYAVTNSAYEELDPLPQAFRTQSSLVVVRNELSVNPTFLRSYVNRVNKDEFFGGQPLTARIHSITAEDRYENSSAYFEVKYEIHFAAITYIEELLDSGYAIMEQDPGAPAGELRRVNATDAVGDKTRFPVNLNGKGEPLVPSAVPPFPNPVYLKYLFYEPIDFAPLNLL